MDTSWQHPFVSVFRHNSVEECQQQGDVAQVMDKQIGRKVFRVRGSTAASNFLQIPKRDSASFVFVNVIFSAVSGSGRM